MPMNDFLRETEHTDHADHPHEECGVIGIYAPNEDVARMTFFGLFALQHLSLIHI